MEHIRDPETKENPTESFQQTSDKQFHQRHAPRETRESLAIEEGILGKLHGQVGGPRTRWPPETGQTLRETNG